MSTTDTLYRFLVKGRELIVRGVDQTIRASWSRDGALVTPTPGTVSVHDAAGTAIVDEQPFTVSGDVAEYTILSTVTADLALSGGWVVRWTPTLPDSTTRTYRNEALLIREIIAPPADETDLYARQARLNPSHAAPYSKEATDWTSKLDEAWRQIEERLISGGKRPELIMSPGTFRIAHTLLTLALIFEDLETGSYERWGGQAEKYRGQYEDHWSSLAFSYDADEDGQIDGGSEPERSAPEGVIMLTSRR